MDFNPNENKEFLKAFFNFQKLIVKIGYDKENKYFIDKVTGKAPGYASLSKIVIDTRDALQNCGLAFFQEEVIGDPGRLILRTTLFHVESGQSKYGDVSFPMEAANAQKRAAAHTYARRYGLSALLGIITEDDDDANAASDKGTLQPPKQQPAQNNPPTSNRPPANQTAPQGQPAQAQVNPHLSEPPTDSEIRMFGRLPEKTKEWIKASFPDQSKGFDFLRANKFNVDLINQAMAGG